MATNRGQGFDHYEETRAGHGNSSKNRFSSGTVAIGEKGPQYRTGLSSKYSMGKWESSEKTSVGVDSHKKWIPQDRDGSPRSGLRRGA